MYVYTDELLCIVKEITSLIELSNVLFSWICSWTSLYIEGQVHIILVTHSSYMHYTDLIIMQFRLKPDFRKYWLSQTQSVPFNFSLIKGLLLDKEKPMDIGKQANKTIPLSTLHIKLLVTWHTHRYITFLIWATLYLDVGELIRERGSGEERGCVRERERKLYWNHTISALN